MCGLRTIAAALWTACPLVLPAAAAPLSPAEQARAFADCAGRYAALREHAALRGGAAADAADRRYDLFADLVEAVRLDLPAAQAARLTGLRASARAAHRALLETAAFSPDPRRRAGADATALAYAAACDRLVPGT
jgi:hypothetical protein